MTEYAENLPAQCPPEDAIDTTWEALYRTVPNGAVAPQHFLSKAAKGDAPSPLDDPCRFASCSLYTAPRPAEKMLQYPRFQGGSVVKLEIPRGAGKAKKKKQHVDFWAYNNFDFISAIKG